MHAYWRGQEEVHSGFAHYAADLVGVASLSQRVGSRRFRTRISGLGMQKPDQMATEPGRGIEPLTYSLRVNRSAD